MSSVSNENDLHTVSRESTKMLPTNSCSLQSTSKPVSLLKLIFDGVSFIFMLSTWYILKHFGKPIRRAFLCADLSISYPPPTNNMFPKQRLYICTILMPIIFILLCEGVRWYYSYRKHVTRVVYKIQICSTTYNIPGWIGNLYIIIGVFLFSLTINSCLTIIGKITIGRFRPHFIRSCFKKHTYHELCTDATQWVVNYTCFGESSTNIKVIEGAYNIRKSFPSSHSSTAFCGLIFLALYIHKTWNHRNMGFVPYVMEASCFALAAYIGITRIGENRHYGVDVLGGAVLGTVIAVIAFRYMVRSLERAVSIDLSKEVMKEETDLDITP